MAESTDVSPPVESPDKTPGFAIRTRYGLSLLASDELQEIILPFLRPEVVRKKIGYQTLRLGIADHQVEAIHTSEDRGDTLHAISRYSRLTARYSDDVQFRLLMDGFEYKQVRDSRAALTSLSFQVATSPAMKRDIMRPPFFDNNNSGLLRARIIFPSAEVVPFADLQAEIAQQALHKPHPSAQYGLASFAFSLSGLQVTEREIRQPPTLRIIESDKPNEEA